MKDLIFLCIASAIFIFSVIVLNLAPTINGLIGKGKYNSEGDVFSNSYGWADIPCKRYSDQYNIYKDEAVAGHWKDQKNKDFYLDRLKEGKSVCLRKKAMIGLEYSAFIVDVIFGFICAILGLLFYSGNNIGKYVGLIGLASGAIGFVLTFIYIIYSGIVFNNDIIGKDFFLNTNPTNGDLDLVPYNNLDIRTTSDGAYMEYKDNKYVCIFYDKDNKDKLYRRYSDYGNKYLNYYHLNSKDKDDEYYKYQLIDITGKTGCVFSNDYKDVTWQVCKDAEESQTTDNKLKIKDENGNEKGECDKLYIIGIATKDEKKKLYNSWVTTIVFGCFIFVLDIGLAIFGFLIFDDSINAGNKL